MPSNEFDWPAVIRVEGYLDKKNFQTIAQEFLVAQGQNQPVILVVNSEGGDFTDDVLTFLDEIANYPHQIMAKIYEASSTAAMIALSVKYREIHHGGFIEIHDGRIRISARKIDAQGNISAEHLRLLRKTTEINDKLLAACSPGITSQMMSYYQGKGDVKITASICLASGLVHKIV